MRSLLESKRLILLLAVLALGALTVLAISLNAIPFRPGQRFVREDAALPPPPAAEVTDLSVNIPIWQQLIVWTLLSLLIVLIGLLLSPEARKRMLLLLIRVGFTVWAIYFLFKNYGDQLLNFNLQRPDAPQLDGETVVPMPVFEAPQVSPAFSYMISFAFALVLLVVFWFLYRGFQRYAARNKPGPLDEIGKIARSSLHDLASGRNSSDVIINCYLRRLGLFLDPPARDRAWYKAEYNHDQHNKNNCQPPDPLWIRAVEQIQIPGDEGSRDDNRLIDHPP